MTGAAVARETFQGDLRRGASVIDRCAEDRWIGAPVRKFSLAMSGVLVASLVIHAGVLFVASTFSEPQVPAPSKETVVELVREPEPKPQEAAKEAAPKPAAPPTPAEPVEPQKPETETKAEIKPEPPAPAKPEAEKPEPSQSAPREAETKASETKASETKAAESKPTTRAEDAEIAEKEAALKSLKQEVDSLKAEQQALEAEARTAVAAAEAPAVDQATFATGAGFGPAGLGTVPPSFSGTLPQVSETEGEVSGYEQIVFSQLAHTKGVRRHMGFLGTAEIVFTVDASGKLVKATIARPSGIAELDEEAMQIVAASAPFPKPPPGATRTIAANFNFIPQPAP